MTSQKREQPAQPKTGAQRYVWKVGDPHPSLVPEYWLDQARNERALAASDRALRRTVESIQLHLRNADECEAKARAILAKEQP